jgi:hypothetical protein
MPPQAAGGGITHGGFIGDILYVKSLRFFGKEQA